MCKNLKNVLVNSISEPVDAFGDFIDIFYADQELQRLEKRIEKLKKENQWGDIALCYSILSDISRAKAAEALEDEDNADMEAATDWRMKAEDFKRKEKDALLKMEAEELERGIKTDEESLFTEHDESDTKKEKKLEDIFSDPGFLEF